MACRNFVIYVWYVVADNDLVITRHDTTRRYPATERNITRVARAMESLDVLPEAFRGAVSYVVDPTYR